MLEEKLKIIPAWMFTFLIMDFVIVLIILWAVNKDGNLQEALSITLIIGAIFAVTIGFLYLMHFRVKMEYRHFNVRLVPFSRKGRSIEPNDINSWQIRPLKAFSEFKGFGKRIKGNTTAFVTDTKFAVEFELKNGKKMVVSIRNKEEWQRLLERSSAWGDKMKVA